MKSWGSPCTNETCKVVSISHGVRRYWCSLLFLLEVARLGTIRLNMSDKLSTHDGGKAVY
jgi:hypothetical protein